MKTITYEDFVSFKPCWLVFEEERDKHADQLSRYRAIRDEWSAIDILRLDEVDAEDRLWLVLREELIDAPILHEFACRCADRAIARIGKPDSRSVAAIEAKRKWLRGEISDDELDAAWDAALAAAKYAARAAARAAAMAAARAAARDAAWAAAMDAAWAAARGAAWAAVRAAAMAAAKKAEREWQIAELMRMLEAQEGAGI